MSATQIRHMTPPGQFITPDNREAEGQKPMDLKSIGEDLGLEEAEFLEIVELFIDTADADLQRLRQALSQGDILVINEAAHSLKGSSGNLGFTDIYTLSKEIEAATRENALARIGPILESITEKMETIQKALNTGSA